MTAHYEARDLERQRNPLKKRYYLAGPMTRHADTDYNYAEFNRVARILREEGYDVMNPAEWGLDDGRSRREIMEECIAMLLMCDALILLRGWDESSGASLEFTIARELGMPVEKFWEPLYGGWQLLDLDK